MAMTTEQKIEKLIDYSNFYNSNMKLLEFNCPEKFYLSNSNDGKDSNSVSVEVESYEEANQIYGTLVFKLEITIVGGRDYLPNDGSVDTDLPLFLIMKIESKEMEYYEKVVESVVALHNIGVTWELFCKVLFKANGNNCTISEWLNKTSEFGVKKDQLEKMFTHHIHRSELNFLTKQSDGNLKLPTPDVYAKQDVDKFYLKKPTNLDSFNFKYEYFLFQCLESQKKARQSND